MSSQQTDHFHWIQSSEMFSPKHNSSPKQTAAASLQVLSVFFFLSEMCKYVNAAQSFLENVKKKQNKTYEILISRDIVTIFVTGNLLKETKTMHVLQMVQKELLNYFEFALDRQSTICYSLKHKPWLQWGTLHDRLNAP